MNKSNRLTVAKLAELTGREVDETLLILWEAGIKEVNDPSDELFGKKLELAKRSLALPMGRQLTSLSYWQRVLSIDENELRALIERLQIPMSKTARRLPKGAIRKLKSEVHRLFSTHVQPIIESSPTVSIPMVSTLEWRMIGRRCAVRLLKLEEVLGIHNALVSDFTYSDNPITPPGPRNDDIIASAVFRQHTSIGNESKYPSVEMSAAALLHSLVHDHPFHNGNKRTALVSMLVLLDENDLMLTCHEDELFKFVILVSQHRIVNYHSHGLPDREVLEIAEWIKENTRSIERGDRPLPFRRLRSILTKYDCNLEHSKSGNNLKITRTIKGKGLLRRSMILTTNISYGGEGREVERSTINKIRTDLQLDEENGVDSAAFYIDLPCAVDEFIVKYKKTLRRLAKL